MKALIFNSGIGKRMGELTKNSPKSMVKPLISYLCPNSTVTDPNKALVIAFCSLEISFLGSKYILPSALKQFCSKVAYCTAECSSENTLFGFEYHVNEPCICESACASKLITPTDTIMYPRGRIGLFIICLYSAEALFIKSPTIHNQ